MRNAVTFSLMLVFLALMSIAGMALARGGTDCPPGSTDPDCVAAASAGR